MKKLKRLIAEAEAKINQLKALGTPEALAAIPFWRRQIAGFEAQINKILIEKERCRD